MNKAKFNSYNDVLEMPGMETQRILYICTYLGILLFEIHII